MKLTKTDKRVMKNRLVLLCMELDRLIEKIGILGRDKLPRSLGKSYITRELYTYNVHNYTKLIKNIIKIENKLYGRNN